jgi:hypothetical protein
MPARNRLDERERGEAECRDVDEPAGTLGGKAPKPARAREERRHELTRPTRRERGHLGGSVVFA